MARTKKKGWSYSAGEKGRNRVRAFEHSSGLLFLEFYENGNRKRISLEHRDQDQAKVQADEAAAKLAAAEAIRPAVPEEITLGTLFEMYKVEVTPTKGARSQKHDLAASQMFVMYLGFDRAAQSLSIRDWERFIQDRRKGLVGPGEGPWKPVRDRTIERDLKFMMAALNWASMAGDGKGGVLLGRNPLKGYRLPKEKNPRRTMISDAEYQALVAVSMDVDWRFQVALVLAHETGRRIGSIRELRWSDADLSTGVVRWRAEHEKTGVERKTPISADARAALHLAMTMNLGIGEALVLPSPKDTSRPASRYLMRDWWHKAERLVGMERVRGRGWHSLRRKFATDLMDVPLKVLCQLGGWKTPETILECYQRPSEDDMRAALDGRRTSVGG
jgi:integrase